MSLYCSVCGCAYQPTRQNRTEWCIDCFDKNFSGAMPPLDWAAPMVSETITITPRQVQALRRQHERWAARSEAAIRQWEEEAC